MLADAPSHKPLSIFALKRVYKFASSKGFHVLVILGPTLNRRRDSINVSQTNGAMCAAIFFPGGR